jgi:hypothetical protein
MQLLQEEIISQYLEEIPKGKQRKQPTSKWAAKIELSKKYTPSQIQHLEYEYYNRNRLARDI